MFGEIQHTNEMTYMFSVNLQFIKGFQTATSKEVQTASFWSLGPVHVSHLTSSATHTNSLLPRTTVGVLQHQHCCPHCPIIQHGKGRLAPCVLLFKMFMES